MKFDFWELEEHVGQIWNGFINRASDTHYADEAVYLKDVKKSLGIIFRAMGGNTSLNLDSSSATQNHSRKSFLKRIAGSETKIELSWQDENSLRLPYKIDIFPKKSLNKKLYVWLTAISAADTLHPGPWVERNQQLTINTLRRFPGLQHDYRILLEAQLDLRPDINSLPADEAQQEQLIQQALKHPAKPVTLNIANRPPQAVFLWLHPSPPQSTVSKPSNNNDEEPSDKKKQKKDEEQRKRIGEREDVENEKKDGLLAIRYENIFSWGEFIKLDRSSEEDDLDTAAEAIKDMDIVHVTEDEKSVASTLKFDLDLPSAANDDLPLGEGILLNEWDYKKQRYREDYCCLQEMVSNSTKDCELPEHLKKTSRRLRSQFESIMPSRIWFKAQADGSELDIDAYMQFSTERRRGSGEMTANMYKNLRTSHRDMSCLLLADLSLSTDSWVNNDARIIDVIQDSLYLFSETLSTSGDKLAIHGFSSRNRNHVRYNLIKQFDEKYNACIRGRIKAIKPGYYTRMGAAIRHASEQLDQQDTSQKLLLIMTDGKPNDLDIYEGRYGIEDTRMALNEARKKGQQAFCVTIDDTAGEYLPYLFGASNYVVIRNIMELPAKLPVLYAQLTQ